MEDEIPATVAVPALLATQLMAAEVYAHFLELSSSDEGILWKKMLASELEHIEHVRKVLYMEEELECDLPEINLAKVAQTRDHVIRNGSELFMLRLEGALRMECAELDYGLEGLMARRLEGESGASRYPHDIASHLEDLIKEARRYSESPNIGLQLTRLVDILATALPGDYPLHRPSARLHDDLV